MTVAGTHGKSTTTSMIAVLLQGAGLDPSFAIGANVPALGVNAASGSSPDLRRGSRRIRRLLPELPPADRRGDQRRTGPPRPLRHRRGRLRLLRPLHRAAPGRRRAGCLRGRRRRQGPGPADPGARQHPRGALRHRDDAAARAARRRPGRRRDHAPPPAASPSSCTFPGGTTPSTRRRRSPSPWNSVWTPAAAAGALAHFTGASRRFEFKGEGRGVRVYDDYAHHPTEVRAALSAARSVAGGHKLHVLFQPHLFSRTREFAEEFAAALNTADTALVLDIYPAREDPIPGVSSQLIAAHLGAGGRLVGRATEAVQSAGVRRRAGGHRAHRRRRRRHGLRAADRRGPDDGSPGTTRAPGA